MNPLHEQLNDRLESERQDARSWNSQKQLDWLQPQPPVHASSHHSEVDELVALAHRLQASPSLQADPNFALRLEGRMLARNAELRQKRSAGARWNWLFARPLRVHPVFVAALSFCLLVALLGTSVLVLAAQVSNPNNPLYLVKHWEQHVQVSLASSSAERAQLDLQFARDRLNTLAELTGVAHAEAYQQALTDLDQQISNTAQAINGLPAGPDRDQLASELTTLEADARHTLRELLPRLALPERLSTTGELGRLGDTVPRLKSAEIDLPAHPNGKATIIIIGDNLQPAAYLLVNDQQVEASGSLQNGAYIFLVNWNGNQHPRSIGILNADGTAAQTTAIVLKTSTSPGNGNGNGNNGKKPVSTPPPHH